MMAGQSGAALALTALAVFAFRAGGLLLAGRVGPHSPVLAWANAVSYAMLAVYVVQTLIAPGSSLQATPTSARIAAAALAVAGLTVVGRGLFQWLVIGTAAFSLGLGPIREPTSASAQRGVKPPVVSSAPDPAPASAGRQPGRPCEPPWSLLLSSSPSLAACQPATMADAAGKPPGGSLAPPAPLDFRSVTWSSGKPQTCDSACPCWSQFMPRLACFDALPLLRLNVPTSAPVARPRVEKGSREAVGGQGRQ